MRKRSPIQLQLQMTGTFHGIPTKYQPSAVSEPSVAAVSPKDWSFVFYCESRSEPWHFLYNPHELYQSPVFSHCIERITSSSGFRPSLSSDLFLPRKAPCIWESRWHVGSLALYRPVVLPNDTRRGTPFS